MTQEDGTEASQAATVVVQPHDATPETITVDVEPVKPGEYWLGLICSPLDNPLLMKHLNIDHGVVVMEVVAESPAANAGLQKQDILIQAGELPLKDLRTLVETYREDPGECPDTDPDSQGSDSRRSPSRPPNDRPSHPSRPLPSTRRPATNGTCCRKPRGTT